MQTVGIIQLTERCNVKSLPKFHLSSTTLVTFRFSNLLLLLLSEVRYFRGVVLDAKTCTPHGQFKK